MLALVKYVIIAMTSVWKVAVDLAIKSVLGSTNHLCTGLLAGRLEHMQHIHFITRIMSQTQVSFCIFILLRNMI